MNNAAKEDTNRITIDNNNSSNNDLIPMITIYSVNNDILFILYCSYLPLLLLLL